MLPLSLPFLLWSGFVKSKFSVMFFSSFILLILWLWCHIFPLLLGKCKTWHHLYQTKGQDMSPRLWKRYKSEFNNIFSECVMSGRGKNLPVSCHSQEWAVFVMMLKYTWGNGEMLWAEALEGVAVCIRETHFCVTSVRCEMLVRYLTYPRTLLFDQADLPPLWHLEAEIYI